MTDQEIAVKNEIIRVVVGSTVHGLAIEGTDDRDEMGVCIPPPEYVIGLKKFEQWTYRTQPNGVRSGPGDLDLTVYSLQKYVRLAAQGNPSILTLLFVPAKYKTISSDLGEQLLELAPAIVSKQAGHRFLGYMRAQRDRMLGRRGQARLPNRPELVEKYGFDTKYAGHLIRLGLQGVELLLTGRFSLPMSIEERYAVRGIREGKLSQEGVIEWAGKLEAHLESLIETSDLPEHPDYETINCALINMYQSHWR